MARLLALKRRSVVAQRSADGIEAGTLHLGIRLFAAVEHAGQIEQVHSQVRFAT